MYTVCCCLLVFCHVFSLWTSTYRFPLNFLENQNPASPFSLSHVPTKMVMFQLQDQKRRDPAARWQEERHRGEVFNTSRKRPLAVGRKHLGPCAHGDIHGEMFEVLYNICFDFYALSNVCFKFHMCTLYVHIHWKILWILKYDVMIWYDVYLLCLYHDYAYAQSCFVSTLYLMFCFSKGHFAKRLKSHRKNQGVSKSFLTSTLNTSRLMFQWQSSGCGRALPLLACRKSGHCPFAFFMPNLEDLHVFFLPKLEDQDTESWKTDRNFEGDAFCSGWMGTDDGTLGSK